MGDDFHLISLINFLLLKFLIFNHTKKASLWEWCGCKLSSMNINQG